MSNFVLQVIQRCLTEVTLVCCGDRVIDKPDIIDDLNSRFKEDAARSRDGLH
jgi:hypothetical protein